MKFFLKPKLALLLLAVAAAHSAQAQDTLKVTLQEVKQLIKAAKENNQVLHIESTLNIRLEEEK